MRIALISDIHGNLPALDAVAADISRRGVDAVVNLGDSVSGPLWPLETAQYLMNTDWTHLAGNQERQLLTLPAEQQGLSDRFARACLSRVELDWLAAMPSVSTLAQDVLLCHGTPHCDTVYLLESIVGSHTVLATADKIRSRLKGTRAAVIACGHSHIPRVVHFEGMLLVNPGSVGLPAYADDHPPHVVQTGSPDARYAVIEYRNAVWQAACYSVAYAHEQAVAKAVRRPDWAMALQSGYALPSFRGLPD